MRGKLDLETRNPSSGATRSTNLGREVRESGHVVTQQGRGVRQLLAQELHPVAGISHQTDGNSADMLDRFFDRRRCLG